MNIYEKMNAIMGDVRTLKKDGKVAFGSTKYNFLSEAKTTEIFHDLFHGYKLVLFPIEATEHREGSVTLGHYTYRLLNVEAPEEFIDLQVNGQGHDSADKGSGKASSYAYKYLLWRTFAIPSNDDPDNISSDEIIAKEKEAKAELAKEAQRKKDDFEKTKAEAKSKTDKHPTAAQVKKLISLANKSDSDLGLALMFYKAKEVTDLTMTQCDEIAKRYLKRIEELGEEERLDEELAGEANNPNA